MIRNIFKRLRIEETDRVKIERGVGKKVDIPKWLTQKELAGKIGISQQTVAKAESGEEPSLNTIKAYHSHFKVPYNTLLGESDSLIEENVNINKELGLSDECIATIKEMSDKSLAMLNAFLSLDSETVEFFSYMADFLTERNNKLKNGDSLKERSISSLMMKEFYSHYLECISHEKLVKVYCLTEDEKALEYNISDQEWQNIGEFQDEISRQNISEGEGILEPVNSSVKAVK